jgi:hypothetical protein
MTRYADPHRCPDCGRTIVPRSQSCPGCGLTLSGETAQQLFVTLTRADELLAALRSAPTPASAATAPPATAAATAAAPAPATAPAPAAARPALTAASVPKILLSLGAGCLLVAALIFLAVTWSVLGVGGRTATLVGFTVVAGLLTGWMARRGLRAAAESLGLVAYGLLTLDVVGADNAGWFGDLSTTGLLILLGGVLAAAGALGAIAVRRSSTVVLVGAEVVAGAGTALLAYGLADGGAMAPAASALIATLVAAAVTGVLHRARLSVAATCCAVITMLSWLTLAGLAVERTFEHLSWSGLWLHLNVWPLLAAALLAAAVALARRLPATTRVVAAAVAQPLAVLAVVAPGLDSEPTVVTLVGIAVLVAAAVATWLMPRPWGLSNVATQVVAGAGVLGVVAELLEQSASRLADLAGSVWAGLAGDRLPGAVSYVDQPAGWVLPLGILALIGTAGAITRASVRLHDAASFLADVRVGAAVFAGSVAAALALYPVPVWLVLGVLLLAAAAFTGWWVVADSTVPLAPAAAFLVAGVLVSLHAEALTLAALVVALLVTGLVHLRVRESELAVLGGGLFAAALAAATWTAGSLADAAPPWVSLVGLLVLGVLVLAAPYAPARWWSSQSTLARTGLEAGAAVSAVALAAVGVIGVGDASRQPTWTAAYLTVVGVVVTVMSLLRADRREAGWVGGLLLALASWVRLWDLGVQAPEPYTLPSAAALLVVGLAHLRRRPGSSTLTALGPGLSLALLPSLLWTLNEPTGPRALLLGVGCLALVLAGVRLRWTAPIALGATVGGLLVLRLAAPYIGDAVPRWVLIGAAGALLIGLGATWERRLQEAREVLGYVRALR